MLGGTDLPFRWLGPAAVVFGTTAALTHAAVAVWIAGAAALALVAWAPSRSRDGVGRAAHVLHDRALQRHLARCRRRGEQAHLLLVRGPEARDLQDRLRIADAAMLHPGDAADELYVLVEGDADRAAVEARLAADARHLTTAWAAYPADGVLLEELVDHARAAAGDRAPAPSPSTTFRPVPARQAA